LLLLTRGDWLSSRLPSSMSSLVSSTEQKLIIGSMRNQIEEIRALLRDNPGLDVNRGHDFGGTSLHFASCNGHVEIVKMLLAHPAINVNLKDFDGATPFLISCWHNQVPVVRLLLKDPRVDATFPDIDEWTPFWKASNWGRDEVLEWLIASGRDLGDVVRKRKWCGKEYTALEIARENKMAKVVSLLERFMANPAQTRYELRVKFGMQDELAAEVFAVVVFLCDDLLQLKPVPALVNSAATRFFAMAKRLPMELQMILCHHAMGSARHNITSTKSETAFKSLARNLFLCQPKPE